MCNNTGHSAEVLQVHKRISIGEDWPITLPKLFDPQELVARVRAIPGARLPAFCARNGGRLLTVGDVVLDSCARSV
jgi:hypothetical protein